MGKGGSNEIQETEAQKAAADVAHGAVAAL